MKIRKIKMTSKDTAYSLYQECKGLFPVWCWDEEELKNIVNDRTGDYEIEFKDEIEADKDLQNLSANDLKEKGIIGITLPERLKMELDYFKETGKHLNIQSITLCSGSRYSDGNVPRVDWRVSKMYVVWSHPDDANVSLRSRQQLNFKLNPLNLEFRILELEKFREKVEKVLNL